MAAYKPTAEDFADTSSEGSYKPSADDFEEEKDPTQIRDENLRKMTGFKGLAAETLLNLSNTMKSSTLFARDLPKMVKEAAKADKERPFRPWLATAGGLADIAKSTINAPHDLNQFLARKLDFIPDGNGLIPHLPEDTGVASLVGLDEVQPEDRLYKGLANALTMAVPSAVGKLKGLEAGEKALTAPANAGKKNILTAPSKQKLFQRALETRIEEAAEKTGMSENDLKALKDSLRRDYSKIHQEKIGDVTPIGQEEAINVKQGKLEQLKKATEIPEKTVGEIPEPPDTEAIVAKKKSALESAQKEAEDIVGIKANPRLAGGTKVKKAIEEVKHTASDLYNAARAHYVDKKIVANNSAEIKAVTNDLNALKDADELAPGYGSGTAQQKALEAQVNSLKAEKVNASDIFDLQRTLEKMAEDTRKKQYSGVNEIEFKRLGSLAERLDGHANSLAKRLEAVGGKDVQAMIADANKGWKTYKDLSNRNPVGKAALKGELPTRAMVEIAKAHPGNDFLSALVESDPELKKHMLAAYAGESNVNKLLKPTSLAKKYIEALPEVEEHVNALKQALSGIKEGEVEASKVKKEYDALVASMKDAANEQKTRVDAIEKSDKLKSQIKFHEDAIPKLKEKMKKVDEHSAEHKRLKKELSDHMKDLVDKNHLLKKFSNMALKMTGLSALGHKIGL